MDFYREHTHTQTNIALYILDGLLNKTTIGTRKYLFYIVILEKEMS
jgi:hypothetical protein